MTIQGMLGASDGATVGFLRQTYPAIAHAIEWPIYWAATLYWVLFGYKVYAGYEPIRWNELLARVVMTCAVFSTLNWSGLAGRIYGFFTSFMDSAASTIMAGKSTASMLDALWNNVGEVSALLQNVNGYQIGMILQGFGLFMVNNLLFMVAVVYMTVAKFGLAITMVLLPLFVGFFLFPQTRQWAMNWLSMMLNFCLIYVLVIAIVRFGYFAFGDAINEIGKAAAVTDAVKIGVQQIANIFIIEGVLIIFMFQVKSWAAALSGGTVIQGVSNLIRLARMFKGAKA
ncbi:MAG: type IV secretion system protein [Telluria sp.]